MIFGQRKKSQWINFKIELKKDLQPDHLLSVSFLSILCGGEQFHPFLFGIRKKLNVWYFLKKKAKEAQ